MVTPTEFALARIAEWETMANAVVDDNLHGGAISTGDDPWASEEVFAKHLTPTRVLAQCKAMRRIVQRNTEPGPGDEWDGLDWDGDLGGVAHATLRHLVAIWSDHGDFQEEWRV